MSKKSHIGTSFNDYLNEEGSADQVNAIAIKRVLAWQIQQAMDKALMSKNQMAKAMHTSRSQLDRILDPENLSIQLDTVFKAAKVLGRKVKIEIE